MEYNFEWDPIKARKNRAKHDVSFEEGASVFLDPYALSIFDVSHSDREDRWITMGISKSGRLIVVCHTFITEHNAGYIRIISVRKAAKKETGRYKES